VVRSGQGERAHRERQNKPNRAREGRMIVGWLDGWRVGRLHGWTAGRLGGTCSVSASGPPNETPRTNPPLPQRLLRSCRKDFFFLSFFPSPSVLLLYLVHFRTTMQNNPTYRRWHTMVCDLHKRILDRNRIWKREEMDRKAWSPHPPPPEWGEI
jgi:hypothetical protein